MDTEIDGSSPLSVTIYRVLLGFAVALVCVIIAGTAFALTGKKIAPKNVIGTPTETTTNTLSKPPASNGSVSPADGTEGRAFFTGIGKIRAPSAGTKPATVIVSIAFPYDRGDIAFAEELASRTKEFREIAKKLFASRTAADLKKSPESDLKDELIKRYNSVLLLGKITSIYFNDYLLID
ncbi:MAG: hypothetical protein WCT14_01500 [Treponemataceae bacterium]